LPHAGIRGSTWIPDFDLARHIGELAALLRHTTGRQAVTFDDLTAR
jgi:hypothetical protein